MAPGFPETLGNKRGLQRGGPGEWCNLRMGFLKVEKVWRVNVILYLYIYIYIYIYIWLVLYTYTIFNYTYIYIFFPSDFSGDVVVWFCCWIINQAESNPKTSMTITFTSGQDWQVLKLWNWPKNSARLLANTGPSVKMLFEIILNISWHSSFQKAFFSFSGLTLKKKQFTSEFWWIYS